jgi:hypothetical protein
MRPEPGVYAGPGAFTNFWRLTGDSELLSDEILIAANQSRMERWIDLSGIINSRTNCSYI